MKTIHPALWINHETDYYKTWQSKYGNACPYFRKEFEFNGKKPVKATLQASALGVFKAYINGVEVDDDYMSPGFTDYRKRIFLMEYDVLDKLTDQNAIVIVAGDGWAVGNMGNYMLRNNFSDKIWVIAKLTVTFEDGETREIITDGSWKADTDEIERTDNYMGEVVNHTWSKAKDFYRYGYDDSRWAKATVFGDVRGILFNNFTPMLCRETMPRIKVMHRLTGEKIYDDGRMSIYDFKQNMTGVIRLKVNGTRGTKITVRHGEMLENSGLLYTENLRRAEATDVYILKGDGEEEFRPLFTFHGFRYAEFVITGNAEIISAIGEVMYSALTQTGEFTCSDAEVSKLYQNIVWGQRGNFLSVPTDCPQRDERLGWTGDAQIFCGTAMYNMDCEGFYDKYIQDLIDSQMGDGAIGGIAPVIPHPYGHDPLETSRTVSAGWGDAMVVIPYEYYLMYGNKKKLKYHLVFAKKFVQYCCDQSDGYIRPDYVSFGDWLSVNGKNCDGDTDKSLLGTEYLAFSSLLVARMCEFAGDDEAEEYYALHAKIKEAFRNKFLLKSGKLSSNTQTSYLLAYAADLMSPDEIRENLLETVHTANDKLTTGFLGVKFLLPTLCDLGESALAYKILTNREYSGWLYSVVNGATTIWERWNGWTVEKGFGDVGMNSFNHYSFGSCGEWMFKYCLGILPTFDGAGFEKLTLKPFIDFSGKMTSAKGSYDSKKGKISVEWQVDGDKAVYKAKVPAGIDLTVSVPDNVEAIIERY